MKMSGPVWSSEARLSDTQLDELVHECLDNFFKRKLKVLRTFRLREALATRNPWLLKIGRNEAAGKIVEDLMRAYTDAQDETIFREVFSELMARIARSRELLDKVVMSMSDVFTKGEDDYTTAWASAVNILTIEFINDFCLPSGEVDWKKLARLQ